MNLRSFPAPLLCGALMLGLAATAFAVPSPPKPPKPPKPNNQAALLQRAAAAARQHQLLAIHAQTSQQHLLKARENFAKQHLLQQARRPERLAAIGGGRRENRSGPAPVTTIQRD